MKLIIQFAKAGGNFRKWKKKLLLSVQIVRSMLQL